MVARDAGLSVEEVRALRGELDAPATFADPADRAVIGWCDALVGTGAVGHAAKAEVLGSFADPRWWS